MRTFITIIAISLSLLIAELSAQESFPVSIDKFEKERADQIDSMRSYLEAEMDTTDSAIRTRLEYELDLYKVELYELYVAGSTGTTLSIVEGSQAAYNYYDVLLNKYYRQLLGRLSKEDQEILRESQRSWIIFRDNEMRLNSLLTDFEYSGGGSIQSIIFAQRQVELVKTRLAEIEGYLERMYDTVY